MSQLDYNNALEGQAGDLVNACDASNLVLTYNVVTGALIKPGLAVCKISGDENGVKLPDASNVQVLGVATRDTSEENTEDSTFAYAAKAALGVARRGQIYVKLEQNVTPDDAVFVRFDGEEEIFTITFDADLVASNSVACSINGVALTATVFAVDHDTTMAALAAKIQALDSVVTATTPGGGSRVITITAAEDGVDLSTNTTCTVTLGASQAVATIANVTGPSGGTQKGVFRTDDDSAGNVGATAIALTNCKFLKNGSAGDVAALDLNLA